MNPSELKVVFFGTPEFAVESLQGIIDAGYDVKAVVTTPDKPSGRGMKMHQSAVKECALRNGLPVLQPEKLRDPVFVEELRGCGADIFVIIAFRMLPEVVWAMPPMGTFNLHASLLPAYRGAAPINWAIINGETKSGVTTFFLSHEIDTGDIILRSEVDILPEDNVGTLYGRLMKLGKELTLKTLGEICKGGVEAVPQSRMAEESEIKPAPKITKETCQIDWTHSAVAVHNLVRGLSPYPCAKSVMKSKTTPPRQFKIIETRVVDIHPEMGGLVPGDIYIEGKKMFVMTGDGVVELLKIQPEGKKALEVSDYLLGAKITDARFE